MTSKNRKISAQVKKEVIKELEAGNYIVSELIKKYGVSRTTINKWRQGLKHKEQSSASVGIKSEDKFIELVVQSSKARKLVKASLEYNDLSISIEGELSRGKLQSIIEIMEEVC